MKKYFNLLTLLLLLLVVTSCSFSNLIDGKLFNNKFYYKSGYEVVKLIDQDVTKLKNIHPVKINKEKIEGALRLILVKDKKNSFPLFDEKDVVNYSIAISDALLEASSTQDVSMTVEGWYKTKYIKKNQVSSARVFYNKKGLNIIFGSILRRGNQHETDPLIAAGVNPDLKANPYVPGSRTMSIKNPYYLTAPPNQGVFRPAEAKGRVDWLIFSRRALQGRGAVSLQDRKMAHRSNIQVQGLKDELNQLKSELRNIQRRQPQNYGYSSQNYGYPTQRYGYPNQQYIQNLQNRNYTNRKNSNFINTQISELRILRQRGLISKQEFEKKMKSLIYN